MCNLTRNASSSTHPQCYKLLAVAFLFCNSAYGLLEATPLKVLAAGRTPNGFTEPPRGWNSFGLQANRGINPNFTFDQQGVQTQANALNQIIPASLLAAHEYYISLDSGWSIGDHGDDYGRITYDSGRFDIPSLATSLHSQGLKLGVYILPGAFCNDRDKIIYGTNIPINATLNGNNNGFARCDFDFSKDGSQQWHNAVIALFATWGVDLIKFDYVTPGSPSNGGSLSPDTSAEVNAYHKAIAASGRSIRLDISWKLDRSASYQKVWSSNADSQRTDQDINNSGSSTFIAWATVQRAIENYRDFITRIVAASSNPNTTIYPDMDNMYIGNGETATGVSDAMRTTIATHWIGAAANLITGSDMTRFDSLGVQLLTSSAAMGIAQFTAKYPMQPRNPGTGRNASKQLQAWIAGPDLSGNAVVVLANYGPDQGQGGFGTNFAGTQLVRATWSDLGISGSYTVQNVWTGVNLGVSMSQVSSALGTGESVLLKLTIS